MYLEFLGSDHGSELVPVLGVFLAPSDMWDSTLKQVMATATQFIILIHPFHLVQCCNIRMWEGVIK
jgi:hypothetical protein